LSSPRTRTPPSRSSWNSVWSRVGFVLQFADATVIHVIGPAETCEIDGRQVPLEEIAEDACHWCGSIRRLVAVGRCHARAGRPHTVYGCTSCVARRALIPLAARSGTDTRIRHRRTG
jgi:hypothetical protein